MRFYFAKDAEKAGWFSRRHETNEAHREAREKYQSTRGKQALAAIRLTCASTAPRWSARRVSTDSDWHEHHAAFPSVLLTCTATYLSLDTLLRIARSDIKIDVYVR